VFAFGRTADNAGYLAATPGAGTARHSASIAGPGANPVAQTATAPAALAGNTFKHVAVTIKGGDALTPGQMLLYEDGTLVDPFGGRKDLSSRVLRHVSEAFAEDPVRILRVARFAARFGFAVHPETMTLMRQMVGSGETDYLVPERVWQEFSKGLAEAHPEKMFEVLEQSGLRQTLLPEIASTPKKWPSSVPARFALLTWPLQEGQVNALTDRLRTPNEVRELALTASRCRNKLRSSTPEGLLELFKSADAFRRPERFAELLEVARFADPGVDRAAIERALHLATAVDAGEIAKRASGAEIARLVDEARVKAIARG